MKDQKISVKNLNVIKKTLGFLEFDSQFILMDVSLITTFAIINLNKFSHRT